MRILFVAAGIYLLMVLIADRSEINDALFPFAGEYLAAMNILAFGVFTLDKLMAMQSLLRVPEKMLLALTVVGGCGGAAISQGIFNHKTAKNGFVIKFVLASVLPLTVLALLLYA